MSDTVNPKTRFQKKGRKADRIIRVDGTQKNSFSSKFRFWAAIIVVISHLCTPASSKPLEKAPTIPVPSNLGQSTSFLEGYNLNSKPKGRLLPTAATSTALSITSGVGNKDVSAGVTYTVKFKAFDVNSAAQISGGDAMFLRVENLCTVTVNYNCDPVLPSQNLPGLPILKQMTDSADGTYTCDYSVSQAGKVTVSVELLKPGGLYAEYFANVDFSGVPVRKETQMLPIDRNWGAGSIDNIQINNVSIKWYGILRPPTTEQYTLTIVVDDNGKLYIDDQVVLDSQIMNGNTQQTNKNFATDTYYDLKVEYQEYDMDAQISLKWQSPTIPLQIIPSTYFWYPERVKGRNSIPNKSKIQTIQTNHIAGSIYTMIMESRVSNIQILDSPFDVYSVTFTRSDGGGSQQLTTTAVYQSGGLYKAELTPKIAGGYTVTVTMTNDYTASDPSIPREIFGSPIQVTVYPGQVDPYLCYSDVPSVNIPQQTANVAYNFIINFVDLYGNLHYMTMSDDNLIVVVQAVYNNHDDWLSPIGVADLTNWQTTYGTSILGTAIDNNDGTMTGSVTIQRAGSYTLYIKVNGFDIIGSPHSPFKVKPSILFAPSCVPVDIPVTMHAGYDYSFLIQGRDNYHNNIADLFVNAVGANYNIFYTLVSDSSITVQAQISDYSTPGVYLVKVSLPKLQQAGDYDLKILLRGSQTPSPSILVNPCTNTRAFDLGILPGAGNTVWLQAFNYTLSSPSESIELPVVQIYCEQELTQILMTAKATFPNGQKQELDIVQLKEHGITILQGGQTQNPYLQVFSEDVTLGGVTFELKISATVFEETTWADMTMLTIQFLKLLQADPFDLPLTYDKPRFDNKKTLKKTLEFFEDSVGNQFFTPIVIFCKLEWMSALPPIIGEDQGKKFSVDVNIGSASTFLTFDQVQRTFQHNSGSNMLDEGVYTVKIEIFNQKGSSSLYDMKVNYLCPPQEKVAVPPDSFVYRYDKNPPMPYIYNISPSGEVKIRFISPMEPKASLNETEIYSPERKLQVNKILGDVPGLPTKTFKNFTSIHNSTVRINGTDYSSFSVAIRPFDPEDSCSRHLDFVWRCVNFTSEELTLQLDFTSPECVSASTNKGDQLVVTFMDQRLFSDISKKLIWPETVIKANIVRQLSVSQKNSVEAVASAVAIAIASTSLFSFLMNLFLDTGLNKLLNMLKNLQILAHILLIQVYLVAHAEAFIKAVNKIIAFQVYDLSDFFEQNLKFDVERSQPLDIHFESLGYGTSDSILNLGPIFASILFLPGLALVVIIFSQCCCCARVKNFFMKQNDKIFFNSIIEFVEGIVLVTYFCSSINIYQVYRGEAKKNASYYFSIGAVSTVGLYKVSLIAYLQNKFGNLGTDQQKKRVGATYTHLAVDKAGRSILVFLFLQFSRLIALAFVITFGKAILAQLLFMNFCSILILIFVGVSRPYASKKENILDMMNEYTILVLYCHVVTQTDFVLDIAGRNYMGWSLICVLCFNVAVNLGNILIQDIWTLSRKLKLYHMKRLYMKKVRQFSERQARQTTTRLKNIMRNRITLDEYFQQPVSSELQEGQQIGRDLIGTYHGRNVQEDVKSENSKLQGEVEVASNQIVDDSVEIDQIERQFEQLRFKQAQPPELQAKQVQLYDNDVEIDKIEKEFQELCFKTPQPEQQAQEVLRNERDEEAKRPFKSSHSHAENLKLIKEVLQTGNTLKLYQWI